MKVDLILNISTSGSEFPLSTSDSEFQVCVSYLEYQISTAGLKSQVGTYYNEYRINMSCLIDCRSKLYVERVRLRTLGMSIKTYVIKYDIIYHSGILSQLQSNLPMRSPLFSSHLY